MNIIASRDNPRFKVLVKLSESSRERHKKQQVLLEGAHLVQAYQQKFGSQGVLLLTERAINTPEVQTLRLAYDPEIVCLADKLFDALSELAAPSGVMAVVPTPVSTAGKDIQMALLIDGVQDPGNLGTLIRSAAAANCDAIYLSNRRFNLTKS